MKEAYSDQFDKELNDIDHLIRQGNGKLARAQISSWRRVPRAFAARAARLAWRADLPHAGLRTLGPIVRPPPRSAIVAGDEEKAEYAQCLVRIGARDEALELLGEVTPGKVPRAYLYLGAIHLARWNYAAAIPLFLKHIGATRPTSYENLVGRVNLAAAYVHQRQFPQANAILRGLLLETRLRKNALLEGNVLGLCAENFLAQRDWSEAERYICAAKPHLLRAGGLDEMILRKWEVCLKLYQGRNGASALSHLFRIREEARRRKHWETVRDCDRFLAVRFRSRRRLLKLYFGTPFEKYREGFLRDWGETLEIPHTFLWRPAGSTGQVFCLNAALGKIETDGENLRTGQSLHRLLLALSADFYRPFRIASLFHSVFPDEHYNPLTSGKRVYQAIGSLRAWLAERNAPLTVTLQHGEARLQGLGPCAIQVTDLTERASPQTLRLQTLRDKFGAREFSVNEAATILGVTGRTALRTITGAMHEGAAERFGSRAYTRYRIR